ncbi:suppressor of deletion of TFIIS [Coemansia erecta]|nr:suppressor of deletion of TFIIS [Coemansia sp. RSA 2618]KAJ2815328.1 suppressor of deletion of TFIIS [Coemansia erecta]
MMKQRIYAYGRTIGLDEADVVKTCASYYRDYGLSVRGLINHHQIDPVEFNDKVDGSLPLESIIKPDPILRSMLESIRTRRWAFTNAGIDHARRVLKCLAVDDLFEGITFCDYMEPEFPCKPEREAYDRAMCEAGVDDPQLCYFADDSAKNVEAAICLGWTAVLVSPAIDTLGSDEAHPQIETIHQLPSVLPQLFN